MTILSVTRECPSSLVVEWGEADPSGINDNEENVGYIVRYGRRDDSADAMTMDVNGTTVSSR